MTIKQKTLWRRIYCIWIDRGYSWPRISRIIKSSMPYSAARYVLQQIAFKKTNRNG